MKSKYLLNLLSGVFVIYSHNVFCSLADHSIPMGTEKAVPEVSKPDDFSNEPVSAKLNRLVVQPVKDWWNGTTSVGPKSLSGQQPVQPESNRPALPVVGSIQVADMLVNSSDHGASGQILLEGAHEEDEDLVDNGDDLKTSFLREPSAVPMVADEQTGIKMADADKQYVGSLRAALKRIPTSGRIADVLAEAGITDLKDLLQKIDASGEIKQEHIDGLTTAMSTMEAKMKAFNYATIKALSPDERNQVLGVLTGLAAAVPSCTIDVGKISAMDGLARKMFLTVDGFANDQALNIISSARKNLESQNRDKIREFSLCFLSSFALMTGVIVAIACSFPPALLIGVVAIGIGVGLSFHHDAQIDKDVLNRLKSGNTYVGLNETVDPMIKSVLRAVAQTGALTGLALGN